MGVTARILFVLSALFFAFLFQQYREQTRPLTAPTPDTNKYWGAGDAKLYKEDATIKPFQVSYGEEVISKLRTRLTDAPKFIEPLDGLAFEYGFNSKKLNEIIKYWRTTYLDKWNEREQFLNQFEHFQTQIQGLSIHFVHSKPKVPSGTKVYPIILLHGWPGSIREFYELIPKLTTKTADKDFVFEVIVPSLPGYGFSEGASKVGLGTMRIAVILQTLMLRLGLKQFYIQGGDWGSVIGSDMTTMFPKNVLGYHSNMCFMHTPCGNFKTFIASFYPSLFIEKQNIGHYYPVLPKLKGLLLETGYMHIQATKPDTIGIALTASPVALAAYILEKFSTWTNPAYRQLADGGLEKYFTIDALLDNVMIYYLTNSITTSVRLYAEAFGEEVAKLDLYRVPVNVPTACAKFKHEIFNTLDWALKDKYTNLIQYNHYTDGGHFIAMQLPDVLYKDLISFVQKVNQGGT